MRKTSLNTPTIADVARECGVGAMTVSRVVNGGNSVSLATAARVRAAIKKLGYEPNEAARILKGQAARTIGLIVPDLADSFFAICAHAVQETAAKCGYMTLLLASERDRASETQELAMMKARNVAGLLIVPSSPSSIGPLQQFRARGTPVVLLDRTFPGLDAGVVMVENQQGAQRAVSHLLDHGYRSIICVGYDRQYNSIALRISGYEKEMNEAGLKPQFILADKGSTISSLLLERLRSIKPPAALFTLNNVTTKYALHALQREGIRVPEEFAIVGFDDFETASLLAVPLTAVRQPAVQLGRSAVRLLLDRIHTGSSNTSRFEARITLPTELIIRRSCGCEPSLNLVHKASSRRHRRSAAAK
jgi:LacI family transcriptional regulator